MVGEGDLRIHLKAFEILLQDDVDHAGHRIGTVHRRVAAGEDFDAVDHAGRDGVGIDIERGIGGDQAEGRVLRRSTIEVVPCSLTSSDVTLVTGLEPSMFRWGMREPVTTTDSVATCCAKAALQPLSAAMVVAPRSSFDFRLVALISNNVVPFVLTVARCLVPKALSCCHRC
jgi:hypothetical protein